MIEYVQGKITELFADHVVIDIGGLGYILHISLQTHEQIAAAKQLKLYTHVSIKEDSHTLYGFYTKDERELFRLLISVSGIGPSTARIALSSMTSAELSSAIVNEDEFAFKRIKGIGPKTAKRIIIELKDKISKLGGVLATSVVGSSTNPDRQEAISALASLGFGRNDAAKAVSKILKESNQEMGVEELIRKALQALSG